MPYHYGHGKDKKRKNKPKKSKMMSKRKKEVKSNKKIIKWLKTKTTKKKSTQDRLSTYAIYGTLMKNSAHCFCT